MSAIHGGNWRENPGGAGGRVYRFKWNRRLPLLNTECSLFPRPWNEFPTVAPSVLPMRAKPCYRERLTVIGVRGPFIGGQASAVKTALKRQTQRRVESHNGCPFADWSRLRRAQRGQSWNVNSERNPICCFPIPFAFFLNCNLMEVQFWYTGLLVFHPCSNLFLWHSEKTFQSFWLKLQKQPVTRCLLLILLGSEFRGKMKNTGLANLASLWRARCQPVTRINSLLAFSSFLICIIYSLTAQLFRTKYKCWQYDKNNLNLQIFLNFFR